MFKTLILLYSKYDFSKLQQIAFISKKHYWKTVLLNKVIVNKIIEETRRKVKMKSKEETLLLIVGILQKGGSNKNALHWISFTYKNTTLSAKEFDLVLSKITKNTTVWQFAWFIANDIAKIALLLEMEGDLSNQIKYEYPTLSIKELVWCSSFQTTNPKCPSKIRNWLVKNYWNRFNR